MVDDDKSIKVMRDGKEFTVKRDSELEKETGTLKRFRKFKKKQQPNFNYQEYGQIKFLNQDSNHQQRCITKYYLEQKTWGKNPHMRVQ